MNRRIILTTIWVLFWTCTWSQLKVEPSDDFVKIGKLSSLTTSPLTVDYDERVDVATITGYNGAIRLVINTSHPAQNSGIQFKQNNQKAWSMAHYKSSFACTNGANTDWTLYNDKLSVPALVVDGNTNNAYFKGTVEAESMCITSDERLKKNIRSYVGGLDEVLRLNPVTFSYKSDYHENIRLGVIAQDVKKIIPFLVTENESFIGSPDNDSVKKGANYLTTQSDAVQYMLVNAIKEQQAIISEQDRTIQNQGLKIALHDQEIKALKEIIAKINTALHEK